MRTLRKQKNAAKYWRTLKPFFMEIPQINLIIKENLNTTNIFPWLNALNKNRVLWVYNFAF